MKKRPYTLTGMADRGNPLDRTVEVPVRLLEELLATLEVAGRRLEGAGEDVAAAVVAFEAVG